MKKFITAAMTLLLLLTCCTPAFAAKGKYRTAGELYQAWHEDTPDYICGVWSTDGGSENLTFGIQDNAAGEAGKQEILDLIQDDSTVSFVYQTYSRNELLQIQWELYAYLQQDLGMVYTSLHEAENRIEVGIYKPRVQEPATMEMIDELTAKYKDAISISYTDSSFVDLAGIAEPSVGKQPSYALFAALGGALVLAAAFILFMHTVRKRSMLVLQPNTGRNVTGTAARNAREVADMVKKANPSLPASLDAKVMAAIAKEL